MGAAPRAVFLSLVLPPTLPVADFDDLIDGVVSAAAAHGAVLAGGNLARSPGPLVVDVTARTIPPDFAPFAAFALGYPAGPASGAPRERPRIVWIDGHEHGP